MTDLHRIQTHARSILEGEGQEEQPIDALVAAIERSMQAMDDWLTTYAYDLCEPEMVAEARERIGRLGTLGYISDVQQQNRAALSTIRKHQAGE